MRIKIDIDNVIRDMGERMVSLYNAMYGETFTKEDIKVYDVTQAFPKCEDARNFFFKEWASTVYKHALPMEDAIEGIKALQSQGHEVILVTYQPTRDSQEMTLDWLREYNVPYDALVFTYKGDKTIIPADYIIDDNPAFLDADSAKKVCIDWAYNRHKKYDYRVKSIKEFADMLLEFSTEDFFQRMSRMLGVPWELISGEKRFKLTPEQEKLDQKFGEMVERYRDESNEQ